MEYIPAISVHKIFNNVKVLIRNHPHYMTLIFMILETTHRFFDKDHFSITGISVSDIFIPYNLIFTVAYPAKKHLTRNSIIAILA